MPEIILKGFKTKKEFLKRYLLLFATLMFLGGNVFGETVRRWKTYQYKAFHFSLQSPFKFNAVEPDKPNINNEFFINAYSDNGEIIISVVSAACRGKDADVKPDEIPSRLIENQKIIHKDWSDFKVETISASCSNLPAKLTTYTFYNQKKQKREKIIILNVLRKEMWLGIQVRFHDNDLESEKVAKRVINSFKILK